MDKKTEEFAGKVLGELRKINHLLDPQVGQPRENNPESAGGQGDADKKDIQRQVSIRHASQQAYEPKYHCYNPCYWYEVWKHSSRKDRLEAIGILFGIGYAIITFFQWQEMRRQTVGANRAWVTFETPEIDHRNVKIGDPIDVVFFHRNVGNSPAISEKKSAMLDLIPAPLTDGRLDTRNLPLVGDRFCETNPPDRDLGTEFQSAPDPHTWQQSSSQDKVVWTQGLEDGTQVLRARACITYESFGKTRHTWTCRVFQIPASRSNKQPGVLIGFGCADGDGAN